MDEHRNAEAGSTNTVLPEVSRRRAAVINAIAGYLALALAIAQGVVLVPLYVKYITVALYGAWLATGNILAWIELVDPGLAVVLQQRVAFAYGAKDVAGLRRTLGTGLVLALGLSMIPLLGLPIAARLGPWLSLDPRMSAELASAFRLGLIGTSITLVAFMLHAANTALQLTTATGVIAFVSSLVGIIATLVMLARGMGLASIPAGLLLRGFLLALSNGARLAVWVRRHLRSIPRYSREEAREMGKMLALTFNMRLGNALLEKVEAFISARMISTTAAAKFTLTGRSADISRTAVGAVAPALFPGLAHLAGEGRRERFATLNAALGRYHGWACAIVVGGVVALNESFVRLWVGHDLFGGQLLTFLQAIVAGFWVLNSTMYQVVIAAGHVRAVSFLTLVEALVRLPLQIFLLRAIGLPGLPLATVFTAALITGGYLIYFFAKTFDIESEKPSREWMLAGGHVLVSACAGAALHPLLAPLVTTWPRFVVSGALVALALAVLVLTIDPRARRLARERLRRRPAPGTV